MQLLPLFLLPFYNPIVLAEQVATMDVINGGRTTLICGLGHQPEVHAAMQTPQRCRVSRFVESFEIMRLLWSRDEATFHGKHYNFETPISINPKPVNQPLPHVDRRRGGNRPYTGPRRWLTVGLSAPAGPQTL